MTTRTTIKNCVTGAVMFSTEITGDAPEGACLDNAVLTGARLARAGLDLAQIEDAGYTVCHAIEG